MTLFPFPIDGAAPQWEVRLSIPHLGDDNRVYRTGCFVLIGPEHPATPAAYQVGQYVPERGYWLGGRST